MSAQRHEGHRPHTEWTEEENAGTYAAELLNKRLPNTQDGILKKYLWDATMVARILRDESYIGT